MFPTARLSLECGIGASGLYVYLALCTEYIAGDRLAFMYRQAEHLVLAGIGFSYADNCGT